MATIDLRYGDGAFPLEYDPDQFRLLEAAPGGRPLSDVEINEKLSAPIGSHQIEEIVNSGETVLLVVPDATRSTGCGQVVNLIVRRLIANGIAPFDIRIIFATGIHRKVTESEKSAILTPFIAQRIKTLDHEARDLAQLVQVGHTSDGIEVSLNRALFEHDHIFLIGGINFHYFAGFTGGRKLICPGLASSRTIAATHKLAFDCDTMTRRSGVGTGKLAGNVVHDAFVEAAAFARPSFTVNAVVNEAGHVTDLDCGEWQESHRVACEKFKEGHTVSIDGKREVVVVSCGGSPHDLDFIQAHKALEAASRACSEGGEIILIAECREGLGRSGFLDWFDGETSRHLARRLCEKYQVMGQTAWSLLEKNERFRVKVATELDDESLTKMRMTASDIRETRRITGTKRGYIIPAGAKVLVTS